MSDPLRVLIVEDEVMLAMAMEDVLADAGHVVVGTAASKKDAIAVADATSPDLVFVDVHLLDGPTRARHRRASPRGRGHDGGVHDSQREEGP